MNEIKQILKNIFCIPLGLIGGFICGLITAFIVNIVYNIPFLHWGNNSSLFVPLIVFFLVGKVIIEKINPLKLNRFLIAYYVIFVLIGLLYFGDDKLASILAIAMSLYCIFDSIKHS